MHSKVKYERRLSSATWMEIHECAFGSLLDTGSELTLGHAHLAPGLGEGASVPAPSSGWPPTPPPCTECTIERHSFGVWHSPRGWSWICGVPAVTMDQAEVLLKPHPLPAKQPGYT